LNVSPMPLKPQLVCGTSSNKARNRRILADACSLLSICQDPVDAMKVIIFLFAFTNALLSWASAIDADKLPLVRLGVSSLAEPSTNIPLVSRTIEQLQKDFGQRNIRVIRYPLEDLDRAIENDEIDIFISSSGTSRRHVDAGVRNLGTIVSRKLPNPNFGEGSAVLVRNDRKDLQKLEDLQRKVISANMPLGFSGHLMVLNELHKRGYDPNSFFGKKVFVGHHMERTVEMVLSGEVDAGIVRTCYWEEYAERHNVPIDAIRVLEAKRDHGIQCEHTTELYPNWSISSTRVALPDISRMVTKSILSIEPQPKAMLYWGVSTDFSQLDQLLRNLEIGPYERLKKYTLERLWGEYSKWAFILMFIVLLGLLYNWRVTYLVRKKTRALSEAVENLRLLQTKYAALQKVGITGMMSSTIAHEIRQPLSAISFYAYALLLKLRNSSSTELPLEELQEILGRIAQQSARADEKVQNIKRFNRSGADPQKINVMDELKRILDELRQVKNQVFKSEFSGAFDASVVMDQISFELIFSNIYKNAIESFTSKSHHIWTEVFRSFSEGYLHVRISNDGKEITEEQMDRMQRFETSKSTGLGLGLPIVISLCEACGSNVTFKRRTKGGLVVEIVLRTNIAES
jgi:two-component system sensor histidine kinase TtrS